MISTACVSPYAASKKRRDRNGSNQMGSFGGQDELSTLQHQLQEMKDKVYKNQAGSLEGHFIKIIKFVLVYFHLSAKANSVMDPRTVIILEPMVKDIDIPY